MALDCRGDAGNSRRGGLDLADAATASGTCDDAAPNRIRGCRGRGAVPAASVWLLSPAYAHGFGERYDLPLPLSLFVIGGALAVALSFLVVAVVLRGDATHRGYPRYNLLRMPVIGPALASPWVTAPLQFLSALLTAYVIFGGLFGTERAALNPAPARHLRGVLGWPQLFHGVVRNLWALVNPWQVVWRFAEYVTAALAPGRTLSRNRPYPPRWGPWPAVLVFVGFAVLETVAAGAAGPRALAGSWSATPSITLSGCIGMDGSRG